jgi:hypothetical protein
MPFSGKPRKRPAEPINDGLLAALMPSLMKGTGLERRQEVRYPTNDPAKVRLAPGAECVTGTILDISKSGLRIELCAAVARGSRLEVLLASGPVVFGTVRYCRRIADAFHVGLLIEHLVDAR